MSNFRGSVDFWRAFYVIAVSPEPEWPALRALPELSQAALLPEARLPGVLLPVVS
jgi:hypothetical protein